MTPTELVGKLKRGDLVEFYRTLYSHWGVYIGNGEIAHVTVDDTGSSSSSTASSISKKRKTSISKKSKSSTSDGEIDTWIKTIRMSELESEKWVRKNNARDKEYSPRAPDVIVKVAQDHVQNSMLFGKYDLAENNCEHFANSCRYGERFSTQGKILELLAKGDSFFSFVISTLRLR